MESRSGAHRGRPVSWMTFAGGIAVGALLAASLRPPTVPVSIDRVAGADSHADAHPMIDEPARAISTAAPAKAPADPRPRLSPQELARRALRFSAAIRGDGVYGSGIVVDTRGYVLTNYHVI